MLRVRPWAGTHPDQRVVGNSRACDVGMFWVLGLQQRQEAQNDKNHVQHHANTQAPEPGQTNPWLGGTVTFIARCGQGTGVQPGTAELWHHPTSAGKNLAQNALSSHLQVQFSQPALAQTPALQFPKSQSVDSW